MDTQEQYEARRTIFLFLTTREDGTTVRVWKECDEADLDEYQREFMGAWRGEVVPFTGDFCDLGSGGYAEAVEAAQETARANGMRLRNSGRTMGMRFGYLPGSEYEAEALQQ